MPSTILTAVSAAVLALLAALAPAPAAGAADLPGAITSVTTDKASYGYNERLKLTFDWGVPDSATAGDTFTLQLPDELKAVTLAKFPLAAPDGTVVANAIWNGKSVVFTLTDYVDSHDAVGGSGFLTVQWDHEHTPVTSQPITLHFGGTAVEVVIGAKPEPQPCTTNCGPAPERTERGLWKGGSWADGAYEGTRDATNNINWQIELPGNQVGYAGPVTVNDTPGAGSIVECATFAVTTQARLIGGAPRTPVDPARYTLDCAPGGFTFTLDAVGASEFVTISYKGTITDQRSGAYNNKVSFTAPGVTTDQVRTVKRTDAGGIGGGVQSVAVGDYVWLDADRDGIQDDAEAGIPGVTLVLTGPGGLPVVDVDGAAVQPQVTDADGAYWFDRLPVLAAGQHYTVTIDQAASAEALKGLTATKAAASADRAADSATDSAESADLTTNGATDPTLDFGFVSPLPELPTLPLPEEPGTPAATPLAHTGGGAVPLWLLGAALALLLSGAAAIAARRAARA